MANPVKKAFDILTLASCRKGQELLAALKEKPGNPAKMMQLVREGADLTLQDYNGYTALHWSSWLGLNWVTETIIEHLEDKKEQVNALDHNGATPLMLACASDRASIAETLLQNGADPYVKDIYNMDAMGYAVHRKRYVATETLKQWMAAHPPKPADPPSPAFKSI